MLVFVPVCSGLSCSGMAMLEPIAEAPPPTLTAPGSAADLSPLLEPIREQHGLPALAAAVVQDSELVAVGAVGLDRADGDAVATADERWHIGSNAKAMTATMVARLVERGVLSWDDTPGQALADLEPDQAWSEVTLEQLLTHTSGLPANPGKLWMVRLIASSEPPPQARRTMLVAALAQPPLHPPGSAYLYSNLGFATAAAMAEAATGASYADLMRQEVFEPLGVADYGFGPPPPPSPLGHLGNPGGFTPVEAVPVADNPRALEPAGTLNFTLASWARFAGAHVDGERGERPDFLPKDAWTNLHRPRLEDYAMGWGALTPDWLGEPALTHSGSNSMWYARVVAVPGWDAALLAATNCGADACKEAIREAIRELAREWQGRLQPTTTVPEEEEEDHAAPEDARSLLEGPTD